MTDHPVTSSPTAEAWALAEKEARIHGYHEGAHRTSFAAGWYAAREEFVAERDKALAEVAQLRVGKQRIVDQHNRLAKQWIYERDKAEAEVARLRALTRQIDLFGTGFVWDQPNGERVVIHPSEVTVLVASDKPTLAEAERDAMRAVVAAVRELVDPWQHDPDCQVGRRELGGKACAHFDERWRHQCRDEVLAVLDTYRAATPSTPEAAP